MQLLPSRKLSARDKRRLVLQLLPFRVDDLAKPMFPGDMGNFMGYDARDFFGPLGHLQQRRGHQPRGAGEKNLHIHSACAIF